MHVKRWESEFQGDEGCLEADCSVKDRLGRKHRETQCGKSCFARLLEVLLCLRPHRGHSVLHELYAAQMFLLLPKCPGHDPPGGESSGADPSRALVAGEV